jgi:hypothetical protein
MEKLSCVQQSSGTAGDDAKSKISVLLSDGCAGECFGKGIGLTALREKLTRAREVTERPLKKPSTGPPAEKKQKTHIPLGSGKYPYTKFVQHLWKLLRAELEKGPVLLVVYSFCCRAACLIFNPQSNPSLAADDLLLVTRNLRGVVFLSPPERIMRIEMKERKAREARKERKEGGAPSRNPKGGTEGENEMDLDWARSYELIPHDIPMHFVCGEKARQHKFILKVYESCEMTEGRTAPTMEEIAGDTGTFVSREEEVANHVNSLL